MVVRIRAVIRLITARLNPLTKRRLTMRYEMTGKERRSLGKIAKRIVIQSGHHTANITEYYKIIAEAARAEFYEDDVATLNDFLLECFSKSLRK